MLVKYIGSEMPLMLEIDNAAVWKLKIVTCWLEAVCLKTGVGVDAMVPAFDFSVCTTGYLMREGMLIATEGHNRHQCL